MKSTVAVAAALAQLAAGQVTFQYNQIKNAPAPTATAPPQTATIDEAAVRASLSSALTAATAGSTAAPAKFRLKRETEPTFWNPWLPKPKWDPKHPDFWDPVDQFCFYFPWKCSTPKPPKPEPGKPHPPPPKPTPTGEPVPPPMDNNCNAQPVGLGPVVQPDTPDAFVNYAAFSAAALGAPTPKGYSVAFKNLNAAYSGYSYITYSNLDTYDTEACAAKCDALDGCSSFNIYFERDPTLAPGPKCPNPPSTTNIRCALWGSAIDEKGANNNGQYREQFQVVIAGSNGYTKPGAPVDVPGYGPPDKCPNGAIGDKGKDWWLADYFFGGFFAPELCLIFAEIQLEKNKAAAIAAGLTWYWPINAYNAFELWEEGKMIGTYCKLYTEPLPIDWCDYKGETYLEKLWEVKNAWLYKIIKHDLGHF